MNNNLVCYDSLNRILIELQCNNAFDIRSFEEWESLNRQIIKDAKPIWVIIPTYESKYVLSEDETKEADVHDMNIMEKNKAVELNLIKRKDTIKDIKVQAVYDIRQTVGIDKEGFEVSKPILNHKELLRIFQEVTNCNVEECDEFFYSTSDNILYIPKDEYKRFAHNIAVAFKKYYMEILDISEYTEEQIEMLEGYIEYSLTTLFRGEDTDVISDAYNKDYMIQILGIIDGVVENIISKIKYTGQINLSNGAIQNIGILKKAEVVVDILTAVYTNKKLVNT